MLDNVADVDGCRERDRAESVRVVWHIGVVPIDRIGLRIQSQVAMAANSKPEASARSLF